MIILTPTFMAKVVKVVGITNPFILNHTSRRPQMISHGIDAPLVVRASGVLEIMCLLTVAFVGPKFITPVL